MDSNEAEINSGSVELLSPSTGRELLLSLGGKEEGDDMSGVGAVLSRGNVGDLAGGCVAGSRPTGNRPVCAE